MIADSAVPSGQLGVAFRGQLLPRDAQRGPAIPDVALDLGDHEVSRVGGAVSGRQVLASV